MREVKKSLNAKELKRYDLYHPDVSRREQRLPGGAGAADAAGGEGAEAEADDEGIFSLSFMTQYFTILIKFIIIQYNLPSKIDSSEEEAMQGAQGGAAEGQISEESKLAAKVAARLRAKSSAILDDPWALTGFIVFPPEAMRANIRGTWLEDGDILEEVGKLVHDGQKHRRELEAAAASGGSDVAAIALGEEDGDAHVGTRVEVKRCVHIVFLFLHFTIYSPHRTHTHTHNRCARVNVAISSRAIKPPTGLLLKLRRFDEGKANTIKCYELLKIFRETTGVELPKEGEFCIKAIAHRAGAFVGGVTSSDLVYYERLIAPLEAYRDVLQLRGGHNFSLRGEADGGDGGGDDDALYDETLALNLELSDSVDAIMAKVKIMRSAQAQAVANTKLAATIGSGGRGRGNETLFATVGGSPSGGVGSDDRAAVKAAGAPRKKTNEEVVIYTPSLTLAAGGEVATAWLSMFPPLEGVEPQQQCVKIL